MTSFYFLIVLGLPRSALRTWRTLLFKISKSFQYQIVLSPPIIATSIQFHQCLQVSTAGVPSSPDPLVFLQTAILFPSLNATLKCYVPLDISKLVWSTTHLLRGGEKYTHCPLEIYLFIANKQKASHPSLELLLPHHPSVSSVVD